MLTALALAAIAATPSLASPGLTSPNIPAKRVTFISDHLAQQLGEHGLKMITNTEMSALLGLEKQKELAGCADGGSSCLTELANALGADGIVTGSIAKLGDRYHVTVKVIAATTGTQLALFDDEAGSEDALLDMLTSAAPKLADQVRAALAPHDQPVASTSGFALKKKWGWPVAVVGLAAFAGGLVTASFGWARYQALSSQDTGAVGPDAAGYAHGGATLQTAGLVVTGVGAAFAVAGAVLLTLGQDDAPQIAVAPVSGGAVVGVTLRWR
jgi:hypothetical protein